jgi:hypothetical protein
MTSKNPVIDALDIGTEAFRAAVRSSVHGGEDGEATLGAALAELVDPERTTVAVAIGDSTGPLGPTLLRSVLGSPAESGDFYYASLIALAKRAGAGASDVLTHWLRDGAESEKAAAMIGLACVGDDRAWDVAYERLVRLLEQPRNVQIVPPFKALAGASRPAMNICYLARNLLRKSDVRIPRLVSLLRERWESLNRSEQAWLSDYWPSVVPAGADVSDIDPPDSERLFMWASTPILDPVF